MKKMTLMNPGPVNVTDRVRDAQLRGTENQNFQT